MNNGEPMSGKPRLKKIEREVVDDAEAHEAIIILWALLLIIAFFLSLLRMKVFSPYIPTPQEIYDYDRAITAFIVIAFVKLWMAIINPLYKVVSIKYFRTYAAAKESWRFFTHIIWIIVVIGGLLYIGGYQNLALSIGLVSAAIVYVLQVPILNAIGWLYVSSTKLYRIGDRIEINGKKGDVADITIMHTFMREINNWLDGDIHTGRLISVPNKEVFDSGTKNYTKASPYIWDSVKVAVTYESNHEKAKKIVLNVIKDIAGDNMETIGLEVLKMADFPELADLFITKPTAFVKMAESSVIIEGVYSCSAHERSKMHSEISAEILKRFAKTEDVSIAYPHMHLVGDVR